MPSFQFATHLQTFLCFSLLAVSTATTRNSLEVGVYTTPNTLLNACNSGNYQILNIAFEISLAITQTPEINLTTHCNPTTNTCTKLTQEIKSCQSSGIRVLLSIGGGAGKYNLNSTEPTNFADYLWNNFLGGQSNSRPLNDVVFDGVDITNERGAWDNWSKLAEELKKLYEEKQGKKFYLSAAPQCSSLDSSAHSIPQPGVFDYVSVQFFGDNDYVSVQFFGDNLICQYLNGGLEGFWESWHVWKTFSAGKVFVKLLAGPVADGMGFIPVDVLRNQVMPELQRSSKFGGVMLWDDELDRGYSSEINPKVCGLAAAESLSENDVAMFPMGGNYGGRRGFTTCGGTCVVD